MMAAAFTLDGPDAYKFGRTAKEFARVAFWVKRQIAVTKAVHGWAACRTACKRSRYSFFLLAGSAYETRLYDELIVEEPSLWRCAVEMGP